MSTICKCPNCGTEIVKSIKKAVKGAFARAYADRLKRRIRYGTRERNAKLLAMGYQPFAGFVGC